MMDECFDCMMMDRLVWNNKFWIGFVVIMVALVVLSVLALGSWAVHF